MSDERPYFHYSSAELDIALKDAEGDVDLLKEIEIELRHRTAQYAQSLIPKVEALIAQALLSQATKVKPPLPVIALLPTMEQGKLLSLWNKAKDGTIPDPYDAAAVIDAIEAEWRRRGAVPPDPSGFFKMPITDAPIGLGELTGYGWMETGLLMHFGYSVAEVAGLSKQRRREILRHVFSVAIPSGTPGSYASQWGGASSAARLKKMANSLAAFARNAKRRSPVPRAAILRWEEDLDYLYQQFYVGHFKFDWPTT